MKSIKINGKEYDRLGVAGTVDKCPQFAQEYMYWKEKPYADDTGWVHRADGKRTRLYIHEWRGRIYLLRPLFELEEQKQTEKKINMKRTTKSSAKRGGTSSTMKMASKILHAQKEDYQKIFRTEVKKASNPVHGAKNAGRIYRDRYGSTAIARWKKALKRAK